MSGLIGGGRPMGGGPPGMAGMGGAPPGTPGGPPSKIPPGGMPAGSEVGDACVVEVKQEGEFQHLVVNASMVDGPVICNFYNALSEPCKILTPRLEKAVLDAGGTCRLASINADNLPNLAQMCQVEALPTIVTIYKGKVIDSWAGVKTEAEVDDCIASYEMQAGKINPKRAVAAAYEALS